MRSEKEVENEALTYLVAKGVFAWKTQRIGVFDPKKGVFRSNKNPHHINGISDILGIFNGKMLAIEMKKPTFLKSINGYKIKTQDNLKKMASEDQIRFIDNVNKNGGIGFFADSVDIIREMLFK